MAKYTKYQALPSDKKQQVLLELCYALAMTRDLPDMAKLLGDLLSEQEIQMIAKRLQIAKLLLQEKIYNEICEEIKVSPPTVARVNLWLQQAGEGFRMIMKKGLGKKNTKIPAWKPPSTAGQGWDSWAHIKRRYPLYFWPQLLLEEIIRTANNRQRRRLLETLSTLRKSGKGKKEVFRHVEEVLKKQYPVRFPKQSLTKEVPLNQEKRRKNK